MATVLIILIKKLLYTEDACTIGWDVFKKKLRINFLYGDGPNNLD